jgi:hypothetical protein
MPVKITQDIIDDPTEPKLAEGKVARRRLQHEALIGWLWNYPKTKAVVAKLVKSTALDHHVRRVRAALKRQASLDQLKVIDQAFFDAIYAQRDLIGRTLSHYVRERFGRPVPWVAKELIGRFIVHVQASACGKLVRAQYALYSRPQAVEVPAGTTLPELETIVQNARREANRRKGRTPQQKTANLVRDVDWYCRHTIEHQSIDRLAKKYMLKEYPDSIRQACPDEIRSSYDGHRLVLEGIRKTAERLDLPAPTASRRKAS